MPPTEKPNSRWRISPGSPACYRSTATPVIARWPKGVVQLAFCWAHVRRRFYELAAAGPAPIASETLERIAALYAIEKDIRGRSAEERRAIRQEKTLPLLVDLEPWLRSKLALISQKSKLAEAIRYAPSRWEGLTRFVDDGRVEMDSTSSSARCARSR